MKSPRLPLASPYAVLLADEHAIVRLGLKIMLTGLDQQTKVEEVSNGDSLVAELKTRHYDLLILDINMRQTESFGLVHYIRREFPALHILIFTVIDEQIFAIRFLKAGVRGYLLKKADENEIAKAFTMIREGRVYLSDSLSKTISGHVTGEAARNPFDRLTDREFEVLLLLLRGNTPDEIAGVLHVNKSTVGTHKSRILNKLQLDNTVSLFKLAKEYRII